MAKKFTTFNRSEVKRARDELMTRFAAEAAKLGLEVELGRITYSDSEFRCKLTVNVANKKQRPLEDIFTAPPTGSQLKLGQKFRSRQTLFTIVEFKWRNHKYPVIAENARGTRYKFTLEGVKRNLVS